MERTVEFGVFHRTLDFWVTVTEWEENAEGQPIPTAGMVELDYMSMIPYSALDDVLAFVAAVIQERNDRMFEVLYHEHQEYFEESMGEGLASFEQTERDEALTDYGQYSSLYDGGREC